MAASISMMSLPTTEFSYSTNLTDFTTAANGTTRVNVLHKADITISLIFLSFEDEDAKDLLFDNNLSKDGCSNPLRLGE